MTIEQLIININNQIPNQEYTYGVDNQEQWYIIFRCDIPVSIPYYIEQENLHQLRLTSFKSQTLITNIINELKDQT